LEEVEVGADAQLLQGAGEAGGTQVQGPLLHVLPGGQDFIRWELAGDHPGVAGVFPECTHVRVLPGGLLAPLGGFRVQLQDQPVRGGPQLSERQRSGGLGQYGVSLGRVLGGQDRRLVVDDPGVHRVDHARVQRGAGGRQPAGHRAGVVHLRGRGGVRQVQLAGQLVGGELGRRVALAGITRGELRDRGQQVPRDAGFQPTDRGDDADQLVIRQPGQPLAVLPGYGVDDGGQQRVWRHVRSRAGLGELVRVQGPGGQAHEQALLRRLGVRLGWRPEAIRVLAVVARIGERVRAHAPRSVQEKRSETSPYKHYSMIMQKKASFSNPFLSHWAVRGMAWDLCL
jgi:hypothetical protein